jgi:hypothetical protein
VFNFVNALLSAISELAKLTRSVSHGRSLWFSPKIIIRKYKDYRSCGHKISVTKRKVPLPSWLRCGHRNGSNSGVAAGKADLLDVAVVGAAAAAQHVELAERAAQVAVLKAQLCRIAVVQVLRLVELGVAAL